MLLADLHYQYLPKFTSNSIWHSDMSLPNSPQVEVLELWIKHGWNWNVLMESRLAEDRRYRRTKGYGKWNEKKIKVHIEHRIKIMKSIKKRGFVPSMSKSQPIAVLETPLASYLGARSDIAKAPEIYHGGRRCAAMYVLGFKTVIARPGVPANLSKFKRLEINETE